MTEGTSNVPSSTGIEGLDDILGGGFRRGAVHVVEGEAGTGKTTLGLHFALAGAEAGEPVLYFTFSETVAELQEIARSHDWDLDGMDLRYVSIGEELGSESPQTMLDPGELYLSRAVQNMRESIEESGAQRVVIDSLSDLRLVSHDLWLFRSQLVYLRDVLSTRGRTTLLLDSMTEYSHHLRTLASGIVTLEQQLAPFGPVRRQLSILKMRARGHATGPHDFRLGKGGIRVYARLGSRSRAHDVPTNLVSSGIDELDALVGGGLDRGSSVLLLGPAGVGKSLTATQYVAAAARRGERSSLFLFDERRHTFLGRARSVGLELEGPMQEELIRVRRIDPGEMSPGEFASFLQEDVELQETRLVVIDSLAGYLHAMVDTRHLELHLHELLTYLARNGVLVFMLLSEHGPFGTQSEHGPALSYLADTVLLFRYFEYLGEMRRALSVYKKRSGDHERLIREVRIGSAGLEVGEPLRRFRGILTGHPTYESARSLGSES